MADYVRRPTDAIDSDFDPSGTDLVSTNAEDAIKELANTVGVSASPGFNFGKSANVNTNTWLNVVGGVPSNRAGLTVSLVGPEIIQIYVANENINTFDVEVYEHEGDETNLTLLGTVNIVSSRSATFDVVYPVTSGRQLACKVSSGSAKNLTIGLQLKGSSS